MFDIAVFLNQRMHIPWGKGITLSEISPLAEDDSCRGTLFPRRMALGSKGTCEWYTIAAVYGIFSGKLKHRKFAKTNIMCKSHLTGNSLPQS